MTATGIGGFECGSGAGKFTAGVALAVLGLVRFVGYVGGSGCGPPSAASEGCSRFLFNRDVVPTGKRGRMRVGLICTLGSFGLILILTMGPLPASAPVEAARITANAVKVVRIGFIVLPLVWGRREEFRKSLLVMRPALADLVVTFGRPCPDDVQGWTRLPDLLDAPARKRVQGKVSITLG